MKKFLVSMAIAILITFSYVSVAYPGYSGGRLIKELGCASCEPKVFCMWGPCRYAWEYGIWCYGYGQIPFAPGGCCESKSCDSWRF